MPDVPPAAPVSGNMKKKISGSGAPAGCSNPPRHCSRPENSVPRASFRRRERRRNEETRRPTVRPGGLLPRLLKNGSVKPLGNGIPGSWTERREAYRRGLNFRDSESEPRTGRRNPPRSCSRPGMLRSSAPRSAKSTAAQREGSFRAYRPSGLPLKAFCRTRPE